MNVDGQKHVLILNTGGTISSKSTPQGYAPISGWIEKAINALPAVKDPKMPAFTVKEYEPLLDSSNMTLVEWNRIAEDIAKEYENFDAFLIFHGTDTMAYTASALSFALENLGKPVIITGSQIPLSEARNDASDNIITSMWLCAYEPIYEVCIYFNKKLFRGNRTRKVSSQLFDAFASPNYPCLANIGINIEMHRELMLAEPALPFRFQRLYPQFVSNFRLFPGFSIHVLDYILQQPIKGLILESYGAGNALTNDPYFLTLLKTASERGVVIVNSSQCQQGYVEMNRYATGYALKEAGLISGYDMTPEALHAKLLYLFSKEFVPETVKILMETNLCGEMRVSR